MPLDRDLMDIRLDLDAAFSWAETGGGQEAWETVDSLTEEMGEHPEYFAPTLEDAEVPNVEVPF